MAISKDLWPCLLCGNRYAHADTCPTQRPRFYPTEKELREEREYAGRLPGGDLTANDTN